MQFLHNALFILSECNACNRNVIYYTPIAKTRKKRSNISLTKRCCSFYFYKRMHPPKNIKGCSFQYP